MKGHINDDRLAEHLRDLAFDPTTGGFRLAILTDSSQQADLTLPPNCQGLGRVHHFRRDAHLGWPVDPLPMAPAAKALGLDPAADMTAQVFQVAACNYRCWYCFVPFSLLHPSESNSRSVTTDELVKLYMAEYAPPRIIDCSGGQPDLVPEWIPSMMRSLTKANLDKSTFLWSDDNLSNDYFWRYLSKADIHVISSYENYARVGCFKGFSPRSFAFNTGASEDRFYRQFEVFRRLLTVGLDQYAYITLTGPISSQLEDEMRVFVDRLQEIHPMLPLRTVPLKILNFDVVEMRLGDKSCSEALETQSRAIECWKQELLDRFSSQELSQPVTSISLHS